MGGTGCPGRVPASGSADGPGNPAIASGTAGIAVGVACAVSGCCGAGNGTTGPADAAAEVAGSFGAGGAFAAGATVGATVPDAPASAMEGSGAGGSFGTTCDPAPAWEAPAAWAAAAAPGVSWS